MSEERYWIIHRPGGTSIHADRDGHPALRVLHRTRARGRLSVRVDALVARVNADAHRRGCVALFRDHWEPRDWGAAAAARTAEAGPLADAFRPRPLPPDQASSARP